MPKLNTPNPPNPLTNEAIHKSDRPPLAVTDKPPVAVPEPEQYRQASLFWPSPTGLPSGRHRQAPIAVTDRPL
ncbi:hypothetical protein BDR22DRAFT_851014 [Usnea florida]